PPYERGSGAPRKLGGDRWVRPSKDAGDGGPSRRPRREPGAPRWSPPSEQRPPDGPPTSR
ncbi:hypothetical protein, partial [Tsukamurella sp. 1534]|uniref:hypothetical protein n=1 Tax=Tsukamurella sp. 1534 TaxID=1151061 RepID=UPI001ED990A8